MAYFALIRDEPQPAASTAGTQPTQGTISLKDLHLNLWCLPAWPLGIRRIFFFDIGLRLRVENAPVTSFQLALPFGTDGDPKKSIRDLAPALQSKEVAQLIFNREVEVSAGVQTTLSVKGKTVDLKLFLREIDVSGCTLDKDRSAEVFSVWTIKLKEPLAPTAGDDAYIRLRFAPVEMGRRWLWKSRFAREGARLDLRVGDIRESEPVPQWAPLHKRCIVPEAVRFFLIVPSWMRNRMANPAPYYIRLLEGSRWEKYTRRRNLQREALVVHAFKGGDSQDLKERPFVVFVDLSRESAGISRTQFFVLLGAILFTGLGGHVLWHYRNDLAVRIAPYVTHVL
ncbi:MAG TPA: hypothetical protein VFF73_19455, partial [Planctomycetota bacterium]|nr:hypothetical protein [Planctomycetota bacterium]